MHEHLRILDAFEARDPAAAVEAVEAHIASSRAESHRHVDRRDPGAAPPEPGPATREERP